MASNFNVSGVVKLVDDFSSKAQKIAAASTSMTQRFDALQSKAGALKGVIAGLGAALAAAFSVHKIKEFLSAAAAEDVAIHKFDQFFSTMKDKIKVGRKELDEEIKRLASLGGFDEEDIMGKVASPLMKSGKIAGYNYMRALRLAVNMAAIEGNTPEALANAGSTITRSLMMPSAKILKTVFNEEDVKKYMKMAKNSKNMPFVQDKILTALETRYGGGAEKTKDSSARTLAVMAVGMEELSSGIGHVINAGFGPWLQMVGDSVKAVGTALADMADKIAEGVTAGDKIKILFEQFSKGSTTVKLLAIAVAVMGATVLAVAVGAFSALAGPIGLAAVAISAAVAAAVVFGDELRQLWNDSIAFRGVILTVGSVIGAALLPALGAIALMAAPIALVILRIASLVALKEGMGGLGAGAQKFIAELEKAHPSIKLVMTALQALGVYFTAMTAKALIWRSAMGVSALISGFTALIATITSVGVASTIALAPWAALGVILALVTSIAAELGFLGPEAKAFTNQFTETGTKANAILRTLQAVGAVLTVLAIKAFTVGLMATLGIGLIPLLVAAAIAAAVALLVVYWDDISDACSNMWEAFKDSSVYNWIADVGDKLMSAIQGPLNWLKSFMPSIEHPDLFGDGDWSKSVPSVKAAVKAAESPIKAADPNQDGWFNSMMKSVGLESLLPSVNPLKVPEGAKATTEAKVSGEVNINIKDPGNNATSSVVSTGNIPLNRGQTNSGSYRSTTPSLSVGR